jgi:putative Mg2+ transporter-C (MgtC) family protein
MFFDSEDWQTIIFRLSMAMAVGCLIGYNRQRGGRPAGLRTFMIVSLGAAMEGDVGYASSNALSRTIQGVASGVGFLGAGIILQQSHRELNKIQVKGLTSAATIWLAAGLGAASGCGLWQMVLVGTFFTLCTLSGIKRLKKKQPLAKYIKGRKKISRINQEIDSSDNSASH